MNLPDGKQLVRESSGKLEEPLSNKRKMGLHAKLAWITLFFCLGLIALAHCVPVEVIYTGEGCDCPSTLDFSVNVPSVPKPKKCHAPYEYGYKVEVPTPRQTKAKVSYSFDFTVEEPRPPKPVRPSKLNLYAKVDRVAINKGDCEDSYAAPSAPSTCRCGQCGISKPLYRYVFNDMAPPPPLPCKCRRPNCKCNLCRAQSAPLSPNAIFVDKPIRDLMSEPMPLATDGGEGDDGYVNSGSGGAEVGAVNIRRKRDLHRTLFGSRKATKERPGRFVKLYHKDLSATPHRLFDFDGLNKKQQRRQQQSTQQKAKRKAKKTRYTHQRSRLVKRDIKGEYELLEKEREQMDLTLPEIIQFMPETLQPDFKRGQCYFGCGTQHTHQTESAENSPRTITNTDSNPSSTEYGMHSHEINTANPAVTITYTDINTSKADTNDMDMNANDADADADAESTHYTQNEKETLTEERLLKETNDSTPENSIGSTYRKRNAANYYTGRSTPTSESAYPKCEMCLSALQKKRAYRAHSPTTPPIPTNPNYKPPQPAYTITAHSASPLQPKAAPRYVYDHLGRKHLENNGDLRAKTTLISVPDPLDHNATPLRYAGDLEAPPHASHPYASPPSMGAHNYPVQHITNEQLDKIIADIVYRHPEFIDATKHYGGALVDPEPLQERETISFLKKLIDGRLGLSFGHEDEYYPQQYSTSYNSVMQDYAIPQLHDLLPPLI